MRHSKKNTVPTAPFNLREMGPTPVAKLTESLGFFRFAHGKGTDRRATVDPELCPHCQGVVEWAITYKRTGPLVKDITPFVYARCRKSPKSHRWDFTHWRPTVKMPPVAEVPQTAQAMIRALERSVATEPGAKEIPSPRPSVGTGQRIMSDWIEARIKVLEGELKDLTEIRRLATHFAPPPPRLSPGHNGHHS